MTHHDEGQTHAGAFGLDSSEMPLLAELIGELVAPLGLMGEAVVDGLRRGAPLKDVLGLPPGIIEVLYARAHTWFTAGRHDKAEELFRTLCVLDGSVADFWMGHGICLTDRHVYDQAELAFATAAALRPDWAVPHFHAAQLAIKRERWAVANDHLVAFEERSDNGLPKIMRAQAARQVRALRLRAELRGVEDVTGQASDA